MAIQSAVFFDWREREHVPVHDLLNDFHMQDFSQHCNLRTHSWRISYSLEIYENNIDSTSFDFAKTLIMTN